MKHPLPISTFGAASILFVLQAGVAQVPESNDELYGSNACDIGGTFSMVPESNEEKRALDLRNAIYDGSLAKVNQLLKQRTSMALIKEEPSRLLDAAEAGVSCYSSPAIRSAKRTEYLSIVKLLLAKGANLNAQVTDDPGYIKGTTPLMAAAQGQSAEIVHLLLEKGAHVNVKDADGRTALMRVARWDSRPTLKLMIRNKAQVNARNKNGYSALMAAALNSPGAVETLLKAGAEVNAKTKRGATALMMAPYATRHPEYLGPEGEGQDRFYSKFAGPIITIKIVKTLLSAGAHINARSQSGTTALLRGVRAGSPSTVQFLLSKGADSNIKDAYDGTPLELATRLYRELKHAEFQHITTLLENHNRKPKNSNS